MDYMSIDSSEAFAHYGRKGMKWGRRLYQNKDGSLTALGRIRYGSKEPPESMRLDGNSNSSNASNTSNTSNDSNPSRGSSGESRSGSSSNSKSGSSSNKMYLKSEDGKIYELDLLDSRKQVKKSIEDMSDNELQNSVNRLRNEKAYQDLMNELHPKEKTRGEVASEILTRVTKSVIVPAAENIGRQLTASIFANMVNNSSFMQKLGEQYRVYTNNKKK